MESCGKGGNRFQIDIKCKTRIVMEPHPLHDHLPLLFVMSRNFVKRDKKAIPPPTGLSPVIQDLIYDAGIPQPCRWLCGREKELEALHELLRQNDKVFLHGIPGIGKSELAKAYAGRYAKEYTNVLFVSYRGSLHQAIAELDFSNDRHEDDPDQRFKRHNRFLRSLKRDTLIIFDNLNTTFSEEPLLDVVCKYRCTVLFTSRNRFEHQAAMELQELQAVLADESIGTKTNRARLQYYQACCESEASQRIKLDQKALELLGQIDAASAPLAAEIHSDMGYQYHVLNDTQQEREHYDRSMLCLDNNGLIGTVDSVPQVIRYAGCVANQKDYMAGIVTMGRLLTQLKDQGLQDTMDYANVCESLAFCLMMMGAIDIGFNHYKNCLAIYEKIYAEEPEIIEAKKDQIQHNCAKLGIYLAKRLNGEI